MGKNADQFKGDQRRKTSDERPFLKRGISMVDVSRFNENKNNREVNIKPPRRNIKKVTTITI